MIAMISLFRTSWRDRMIIVSCTLPMLECSSVSPLVHDTTPCVYPTSARVCRSNKSYPGERVVESTGNRELEYEISLLKLCEVRKSINQFVCELREQLY